MTYEDALQHFGLPASPESGMELRRLLASEIEKEERGESSEEMLRALCLLIFSIGSVHDALLIWKAKQSSFDASCSIDIQFICGAGLAQTKGELAASKDPAGAEALGYLLECEAGGDFDDWKPDDWIARYRDYYGV